MIEGKEAVKKAHEILVEFAKQTAVTSAAILTLFATLVSAKIIDLSTTDRVLAAAMLTAIIICVFSTFWLMLAIAGTLDAVGFPDRSPEAGEAGRRPSIYRKSIQVPLWLVVTSFVVGLTFLALIVFV